MSTLYIQPKELLAPGRVQLGEVTAYAEGMATVDLPGGGQLRARGQASVGTKVFVQDGVIQGPAPDLPMIVDVI